MAQFSIEIADQDVNRVLNAVAKNDNRSEILGSSGPIKRLQDLILEAFCIIWMLLGWPFQDD